MNLALFDFDGTITKNDSFLTFLHFALTRRRLFFGKLVLSPFIVGYRLGLVKAPAIRTAIARVAFRGQSIQRMEALGETFAREKIPLFLRENALERLKWHKEQGDRIVVVSASLDIYLAKWCNQHGLEYICTELEAKDGRLTGRYVEGDCSCEEKRRRILARYNINDYSTIYAYGDTDEDQSMLDLADKKFFRWESSDGTNLATSTPPMHGA